MPTNLKKLPHTCHNLNNILDKSEKFSHLKNKLFDDLVIPPGFCVNINMPLSNLPYHFNHCNNCIDDNLHSNLIKLIQEDIKETKTKKTKKNKKKKSNETKKSKK